MERNRAGESGAMMEHFQNTAIGLVETACSIVCRPLELVLRLSHGSRYFSVPVVALSSALMILLPVLGALAAAVIQMIPFAGHPSRPAGLFDMADFAELYAALSCFHFFRIYRRMVHVHTEQHSRFEGPPLFFFRLIPGSGSWWRTRIVLEPCLILITASVLQDLFIIQSSVALYLRIAALALCAKECLTWYGAWQYVRDLLDAQAAGPIMARLVENKASAEDLAAVHIATLPPDLSPELRDKAAVAIARAFSPITYTKGETHEAAQG
jgi:hypothetical protein